MNIIYEKLKSLIPIQNAQKYRDDGEFLVVMSYQHSIQYLNEVAKEFYLKLDGRKTVCEIVADLLAEYDVSEDILENDMIELIRNLQWNDLIMLKNGGEKIEKDIYQT